MRFALAIVILLSATAVASKVGAIVERISPKGFRIKTSDYIIDDRIAYVIFNVNLNKSIEAEAPTDFVALITDSLDGQWVYDNVNTRVEGGWKVSYRIDLFYEFDSRNNSRKPDRIISTDAEFPYYTIDITAPIKEKCAKLYRLSDNCELSVTTVRGQAVCKGQRVFEEHFDELDPRVWKIDARIPWDTEDSPFLSYQNDPEVVFIKNVVQELVKNASEMPDILRSCLLLFRQEFAANIRSVSVTGKSLLEHTCQKCCFWNLLRTSTDRQTMPPVRLELQVCGAIAFYEIKTDKTSHLDIYMVELCWRIGAPCMMLCFDISNQRSVCRMSFIILRLLGPRIVLRLELMTSNMPESMKDFQNCFPIRTQMLGIAKVLWRHSIENSILQLVCRLVDIRNFQTNVGVELEAIELKNHGVTTIQRQC